MAEYLNCATKTSVTLLLSMTVHIYIWCGGENILFLVHLMCSFGLTKTRQSLIMQEQETRAWRQFAAVQPSNLRISLYIMLGSLKTSLQNECQYRMF